MNPFPLILSFWVLCFCLTAPVGWPYAVFGGFVFGWNAGLYYAAWKIKRIAPTNEEDAA
jgi:hypothetical protein